MARPRIRVTSGGDEGWKVNRDGAKRTDSVHDKKSDAVDRARELAKDNKPSQVVIHKRDGKIQEERTYEKDPYPPKG
jgi:hypothetical protein